MHFAPDTELALAFIVALTDTHPSATRSGQDELVSNGQLTDLLNEHGYSGRMMRDANELAEVRDTRELLRRVWVLDTDQLVDEINRMLAEAEARPYLISHDQFPYHLHATSQDAPLAERIRVESALALVDVIRSGETDRMRVCEADDCEGLVIDLSRNGSKRYCSVRCGNRMHQLAHRERAAADSPAVK